VAERCRDEERGARHLGGDEMKRQGQVTASYTHEGLGQNGADGLHGLEDGPCDFFKSLCYVVMFIL
jgi:hypothetical protein